MLLLAIVETLNARQIVEVGTASGRSLCSFLSAPNIEFVTNFDIIPLSSNMGWISPESIDVMDQFLEENRDRWSQHVVDVADEPV